MGSTPSISDLRRQNAEFDKFIVAAKTALEDRTRPDKERFDKFVQDFYARQKWDQQFLAQGRNEDYRQAAEFSLDGVQGVLKQWVKSLFSGGPPPVGGVVGEAIQVARVASSLIAFEALAFNAATAFVQASLGAFDSKVSIEFHSNMSSKSLAPGLTLHVWSYGDSFHRRDFFNNEYIIENVLEFRLIYSFAQAEVEQDIEYLNSHTLQIEQTDDTLRELQNHYLRMLADPTSKDKDLDALAKRINTLKALIESYREEVHTLVKRRRPALVTAYHERLAHLSVPPSPRSVAPSAIIANNNYSDVVGTSGCKGIQAFNQSDEAIQAMINISNGICRGLVTLWLAAKKNNTSFWTGRSTVSEPLLGQSRLLAKAVKLQDEYERASMSRYLLDQATQTSLESSGMTFKKDDIIASAQFGFAHTDTNNEVLKISEQVLGKPSRFYILSIKGESGGHSIGLYRPYNVLGKSTKAYVFDPNVGEFEAEGVAGLGALLRALNSVVYEPRKVDLNQQYVAWSFYYSPL
jgi:hypothetical protein